MTDAERLEFGRLLYDALNPRPNQPSFRLQRIPPDWDSLPRQLQEYYATRAEPFMQAVVQTYCRTIEADLASTRAELEIERGRVEGMRAGLTWHESPPTYLLDDECQSGRET